MSYKVKCWGEWWVMNLEGIWKEVFVAQLGFSLEEMSKTRIMLKWLLIWPRFESDISRMQF